VVTLKCEIKIEGLDEIRRKFAEAGKRMSDAMGAAVGKGVKEIEKQAKYNATRGGDYPEVQTGELLAGIKSGATRKGKDYAFGDVGFIGASADLAIKANSVEYGHVMTVVDPDSGEEKIEHVPPKPFMRPAIEQSKRKVVNIVKNELEKQFK
jgi:HK97 gp10 family phage protein